MSHGVTLAMLKIKKPPAVAVKGPGPTHRVTHAPINIHTVAPGEPVPRAIRRARKLQAKVAELMER
jgi:hypothetical protein